MIKKEITYTDFDDHTITETHYFHLSKSELIDLELGTEGGLAAKLQRVGKSADGAEIIKTFKELISAAYGQRVEGSGSKFLKSPEMAKEFMGSLAFDALLTTLLTDSKAASDFVNGIIPKDLTSLSEQVSGDFNFVTVPHPDGTVETITRAELAKRQKLSVPDPNNLDTGAGAWPRGTQALEADDEEVRAKSSLANPYDSKGNILPWAFRKPTSDEQMSMDRVQILDVMGRANQGWKPDAGS